PTGIIRCRGNSTSYKRARVQPGPALTVRSGHSLTELICERSITSPSSFEENPSMLCPPLFTAIGKLFAFPYLIAADTSSVDLHIAITNGYLFILLLKTFLDCSYCELYLSINSSVEKFSPRLWFCKPRQDANVKQTLESEANFRKSFLLKSFIFDTRSIRKFIRMPLT